MKPYTKELLLSQTKILIGLYSLTVLIILCVKIICVVKGLNLNVMMHDPVTAAGAPFYTGCLSNLGILGWAYAASVFFFAWTRALGHSETRNRTEFLFCSWLLSTLFTLDDLFLLHEEAFPSVFDIPQKAVYAAYFILTAAYLFAFQKIILSKFAAILIPAFFFFGLSIVGDEILTSPPIVLEDGAKLLGIATWAFYAHTAARDLSAANRRSL